MKAFILVRVPAPRSGGVVGQLRKEPGVEEAWAVYGEHDIIVKANVSDNRALDKLVMETIQNMPQVESTRTFVIIESL